MWRLKTYHALPEKFSQASIPSTPGGIAAAAGAKTVGDLDILGDGSRRAKRIVSASAVAYTAAYPAIANLIAKGQKQSQLQSAHRIAGGCASLLPKKSLWRCAAILLPARRCTMWTIRPARDQARLHTERICASRRVGTMGTMIARGGQKKRFYRALDLAWIPAELRENSGEIEAAAQRQPAGN